MSSVGVFEKKSKCFVRKKKSKCPKENFQSVKRGKCLSIEFRVFRKKMKEREKKRFWKKMFGWNFFAKFVFTG